MKYLLAIVAVLFLAGAKLHATENLLLGEAETQADSNLLCDFNELQWERSLESLAAPTATQQDQDCPDGVCPPAASSELESDSTAGFYSISGRLVYGDICPDCGGVRFSTESELNPYSVLDGYATTACSSQGNMASVIYQGQVLTKGEWRTWRRQTWRARPGVRNWRWRLLNEWRR